MLNPVSQSNSRRLNILFLEDSEDDYELIKRKIQKEGYILNAACVDNAADYEAVLNDVAWDIVISDNSLPSFDATSALKITRAKYPFLPFIIVSGSIGEEIAVAAMRSGANDYLLKNDLARLVPAIERELADVEFIKAKHQADEALKESEERYRLLAENIQDLVCMHDPDSSYLWLSPSVEKILGYKPEELIGVKVLDLIHPEDLLAGPPMEGLFKKAESGHVRLSYRLKRKDDSYIHVEAIIQPVYESGEIIRVVSTTRDVTEQYRAHELLARSEAKYHSVIESMAEGLVIYDDKGNISAFNTSATTILDIKAATPQAYEEAFDDLTFVTPDLNVIPHEELPSRTTLKSGTAHLKTIIGARNKDELIWLSIHTDPFWFSDKKRGVVLSFSDITEQKLYQDSLSAVAKELTTLIDTANAPIFGIDWNGIINEWNQVTAKITGYSKTEVLGKKLIDEFILDNYKVIVTDLLKSVLRGKDVTRYELPIYTKAGDVVTILFNATARRNPNSEIVGVISVGQDITELIEHREQLESKVAERTKELHKSLQKEKELVALKSKFVSMASHEFRTPLSTITFATGFIKKYHSKLEVDEIEGKLNKIEEQVHHMTYLLDDVLLIGKSESGTIKLHPVRVVMEDFCGKIIEEVAFSTKNSHKILFFIVAEQKAVYIDEKLLRNIVINLLSNAIKFSPGKDSVLMDVKVDRKYFRLSVQDWGMGIKQEDMPNIFDAFHRSGNVGAIQGTGLGLSIVKKAVELQQGDIKVHSILDKGTTIQIKIPLQDEESINH